MSRVDTVRYTGAAYEKHFEFWKKFKDDWNGFLFRQNHLFNTGGQFERVTFSIQDPSFRSLVTDNDSLIYVTVASACGIFFSRCSGSTRIVFASPVHRDVAGDSAVSEIPIFMTVDREKNLRQFLKENLETTKYAFLYQHYPIKDLPYFEDFLGAYESSILISSAQLHREAVEIENYDLSIRVDRQENEIRLEISYNVQFFERYFIENAKAELIEIFSHFADLDAPLGKIINGRRDVFVEEGIQSNETIVDLFTKAASKNAERIAVEFNGESLSYAQLHKRSNSLAKVLQTRFGIKHGDIVMCAVDRSEHLIVSQLGISKAGAAFLPVDPSIPIERLKYIFDDSDSKLILTVSELALTLSDVRCQKYFIDVEPATDGENDVIINGSTPDSLAYVIYTSGSTGLPKGVMIEHRSLVNLVLWHIAQFGVHPESRASMYASVGFDASVWEIWPYLSAAATLYPMTDMAKSDPSNIADFLRQNRITHCFLSTSVCEMIFCRNNYTTDLEKDLLVLTGGDKMTVPNGSPYRVVNNYGLTECCVVTTSYPLEANHQGSIPIGKPIFNTQAYIVNKLFELTPVGVVGELVIGGIGVARGYINNQELTSQKFCQDFISSRGRLYKTGDLCRLLATGDIEFIGREDNQVQIRGARVELGEVESLLLKYEGMQSAAVVSAERNSRVQIIAFCISEEEVDVSLLRSYLAKYIAPYMIPDAFFFRDSFPLTHNGKVDKRRLLDEVELVTEAHAEPTSDVERSLLEIFENVLKTNGIGIRDNLFALGLDSLKALRVVETIGKKIGPISIGEIFTYYTVERLAGLMGELRHTPSNAAILADGHTQIEEFKQRVLAETLIPNDCEDIYPITAIENGMIYTALLRPEVPIYYDQIIFQADIHDISALTRALELLVQKHSILRTRFYLNLFREPMKMVINQMQLPIVVDDISSLNGEEQRAAIDLYNKEDSTRRFEFRGEILWRMRLFHLGDSKYYITWSVFHSIMDGWSVSSFIAELSGLLADPFIKNRGDLEPLKSSYKDYCAWTLGLRASFETTRFWQEKLSGYTRSKLPFNLQGKRRRRDTVSSVVEIDFDDVPVSVITETAVRSQVMPKAVCLAAYVYLLHLICRETDITFGTVSNDRPPLDDGDRILGCFLNTLPFRIDIKRFDHVNELISFVNESLIEMKNHEVHLVSIADVLGEKNRGNNPFFDCIFNFTDFHIMNEWKQNNVVSGRKDLFEKNDIFFSQMTNTLFDFEVDSTYELLHVRIKYSTAYFEHADMKHAVSLYHRIIKSFIERPAQSMADVNLLTGDERVFLLNQFNNTVRTYDNMMCLHELLERSAATSPHAPAVVANDIEHSYFELNQKSNQLAHLLLRSGARPGKPIAIIMGKTPDMIIAMFAILKAGCHYVPIDPAYPAERQKFIIKNSQAELVIADEKLELLLHLTEGVNTIFIGDIDFSTQPRENLAKKSDSRMLAYVIYTSGSTGVPKGVMIQHHSAINLIQCINEQFEVTSTDKLILTTSISFDLSVYDIFGMIAAGGTILLPGQDLIGDNTALLTLVADKKATFFDAVPTTMQQLVEHLEANQFRELSSIRRVFMSGDWVPLNLQARIKKFFPNASVVALGGATEATIWSNYFEIDRVEEGWLSIPYGKPLYNNFFYILDEQRRMVPIGVAGELYIGGAGVAEGYIHAKELSEKAFVPNTFCAGSDTVMYKTGDLGRMMTDGNMEFLGRLDHQVKINGYRIELQEIEMLVTSFPGVRDVKVLAKRQTGDLHASSLVAYITCSGVLEVDNLRRHLSSKLAFYMVPSHFVVMDSFPVNSNGKIDIAKFPDPVATDDVTEYKPPVTNVEKELAEILGKIVSKDAPSIVANYFDLGLNSLKLIAFLSQIQNKFPVDITITDLFSTHTIELLAAFISERTEGRQPGKTEIKVETF